MQPFVALGAGLKKIGHEITICTSYSFKRFITEKGLNYGYMNDDYIKFIGSEKAKKTILSTTNIVAWLQKAIELSSQIKPLMNRALTEQWLAAKDAELILYC
ncbi:MAG: glycosyltransferase [Prochloraceae cyanobacterium]|nr:glycosyltransferase [Prochloraceae cyanobacterium]